MSILGAIGAVGGALGGAGLNVGSGLITHKLQADHQRKMQKRNFQHQIYMARNRYGFTMESMRNAGLNPMLAYQQGGGPGGSMTGIGSTSPNIDMAKGAAEGLKATKYNPEVDLLKRQVEATGADRDLKGELGKEAKARKELHDAQRRIAEAQLPYARVGEDFYNSDWGKLAYWMSQYTSALGPILGLGVGYAAGKGRHARGPLRASPLLGTKWDRGATKWKSERFMEMYRKRVKDLNESNKAGK